MSQANAENRRWIYQRDPGLHGTARFADRHHLAERGYGPGGPHVFGYLPSEDRGHGAVPVTYGGARHMLTVAPNRSGKGVSTCIPALLTYPGSAIVLDPRGEVAAATCSFREAGLRQETFIFDPMNAVSPLLGRTPARFNPLDAIQPDSPSFYDDACLLADALVIGETHSSPFWSDEARAFITGLILQVTSDVRESETRTLGRVRDLLNMPPAEFRDYVAGDEDGTRPGMLHSANRYVRAAAGRILSKPERQYGDILATAQQNTHFLESEQVRESLSVSDFDFADLSEPLTIYLVLPPERLRTHGRLLRLLIAQAIDAINQIPVKPTPSVLFMLDEMGAVGKLDVLLDAFGVLAGSGMQLHPIFQDFAQAKSIYGERWQTFIANAAVIQAFGTRDLLTAEYLSKLCGTGTFEQLSYETAIRRQTLVGDPDYFAQGDQAGGRALMMPDEIMTLHPAVQILVLANANPAACYRVPYFLDARFRDCRGRPVFDVPANYRRRPVPRAVDFTRPGLNVMRALAPFVGVG